MASSAQAGSLYIEKVFEVPYPMGSLYFYTLHGYIHYDIDNDGEVEALFIVQRSTATFYTGLLLIVSTSGVEKYTILKYDIPYSVMFINSKILVFGYNVLKHTYEVVLLNRGLDIISGVTAKNKYTRPCNSPVINPPLKYNETVYFSVFAIPCIYPQSYYSMLLAYNSKNNSLDILLELNNTIINTRPYIINDTDILWGKYIIRPSNRTIIDLLNDTRLNDYDMAASFLYRNRIYIEVYINESFKFIVFNDENYRILDVYELNTTHIDDLFIINSKYYGFSLDYIVDNGSKTINFKLYLVKQNLLDLYEIFNISGTSLGFGYDEHFIYLFVDNTLWFIDPINQTKASIWINVSKLSKPFTDIIVLGSNYHEKH